MKTIILSIVLVLTANGLEAQSIAEDVDFFAGPEWYEGTIVLNSGAKLKGLLKYNDKADILSYECGRESRSFTARSVKTFQFFDEIAGKSRSFCTISIEDRKHNVKRPLFFEVVMELNDFVLLSKLSPIKFEKREYTTPAIFNPGTGSFSAGRYYGFPSTISLTETLFVMSSDGHVHPYLQIVDKDVDGVLFDRSSTKNRILDEEAIKNSTGPRYKKLTAFAKENDLHFDEKNELLKILSHYQQLTAN